MTPWKMLAISLLFFVLALVQNSFLPYFFVMGAGPNLVFILFFMVIFFNRQVSFYEGIFFALLVGFLSYILSPWPSEISIVSFLAVYFLVNLSLHFLQENRERYFLIHALLLFLMSFIFCQFLQFLLTNSIHIPRVFAWNFIFVQLFYNAVIVLVVSFVCHIFFPGTNRQLTLFK